MEEKGTRVPLLENILIEVLNVFASRIVKTCHAESLDEFERQEKIFQARNDAIEQITEQSEGIVEWKKLNAGKSKTNVSSNTRQIGKTPSNVVEPIDVYGTGELNQLGRPSPPKTPSSCTRNL